MTWLSQVGGLVVGHCPGDLFTSLAFLRAEEGLDPRSPTVWTLLQLCQLAVEKMGPTGLPGELDCRALCFVLHLALPS